MNGKQMLQWIVIVSVALLVLPTALHLVAQDVVSNELEVVGIIDGIDGDMVTVNGQVFDIANAELKGELAVGEMVKIHASLSDTDAWVAREVETVADFGDDDGSDNNGGNDDDQPELSITGILEEVGEGYIIVSGLRIDTTGAEVDSILIIGDMVKIHQELLDGNLVVREVEMDDDQDNMDDDQDNMGDDQDNMGDDQDNMDDDHTSGKPDDWVPYIVQPGDTLNDLAAIIGTSPEALAAVNGIDVTQELVAGSILYGPAYHSHDSNDDDYSGAGVGDDSHDDDSSYDDKSSHDDDDDKSNDDSHDDDSSHDDDDDKSSHDDDDDDSSHDDDDDDSSHDDDDDKSNDDSHDDDDDHH